MIAPNDHIKATINFSFEAVMLDQKQPGFDASAFKVFMADQQIKLTALEEDTYSIVKEKTEADGSYCSLCSRLRRGILYNHANQSAAIVEKFPSTPQGVGIILKEHHGAKNGIGFPESLSIAISPLSMMFIVVEHFVDEFLKIDETPKTQDLEKILEKLGARYNKATYGQTLVALQEMALHKKSKEGLATFACSKSGRSFILLRE